MWPTVCVCGSVHAGDQIKPKLHVGFHSHQVFLNWSRFGTVVYLLVTLYATIQTQDGL